MSLAPALVPDAELPEQPAKPIRVGIIGCDTSHVTAFTDILHSPKAEGDLAGFRVVAAFPGGSPDVASSRDRIAGFVKTLKDQHDVQLVAAVPPGPGRDQEQSQAGRYPRLRRLLAVLAGGAPPRSVLVRRPRRGNAVCRHGHRLREGGAVANEGDRVRDGRLEGRPRG